MRGSDVTKNLLKHCKTKRQTLVIKQKLISKTLGATAKALGCSRSAIAESIAQVKNWEAKSLILTQPELKKVMFYDPEIGNFYRLKLRPQDKGRPAGATCGSGYRVINVLCRQYKAHRLAWLYVFGVMPSGFIDHVDGNRANNKISNLRDITPSENAKNQRLRSDNTSGFNGVIWSKTRKKFRATLRSDNGSVHLGYYDDKEAAIKARKAANLAYGFHENHGQR